jgi:hypothetical protein
MWNSLPHLVTYCWPELATTGCLMVSCVYQSLYSNRFIIIYFSLAVKNYNWTCQPITASHKRKQTNIYTLIYHYNIGTHLRITNTPRKRHRTQYFKHVDRFINKQSVSAIFNTSKYSEKGIEMYRLTDYPTISPYQ